MRLGWRLSLAFAFLLVFSCVALYFIENIRGKAVLEETLARVSGDPGPKGFRSHDEFIPPDEENFFCAPILACLSEFRVDPDPYQSLEFWDRIRFDHPAEVERLRMMSLPQKGIERYGYVPINFLGTEELSSEEVTKELTVWAALFRESGEYSLEDWSLPPSGQILQAIQSRFGRELAELAEAAQRPYSNCPTLMLGENEIWSVEVSPAISTLDPLLRLLSLRLICALEAGEPEVFRETWIIYRKILEGSMRQLNSAGLFAALTRYYPLIAGISMAIKGNRLKRDDLLFFHRELRGFPFDKLVEGSYAEEIVFTTKTYGSFNRHRLRTRETFKKMFEPGLIPYFIQFAPDGWIDLNAAASIRWTFEEGVLPWRNLDFRSLNGSNARRLKVEPLENVLAGYLVTPYQRSAVGLAEVHVKKELTQLACLLEAFAMDRGGYPEELGELIPEYLDKLPRDPFTGEVMKYFPDDDRYRLYSVGMNLSDDFANVVRNERGRVQPENGDWVWGAGNQISPEAEIKREMAVFRIRAEAAQGHGISEEAFAEAWARHIGEFKDPTTEALRKELLIQKMRNKIKQEKPAPRP